MSLREELIQVAEMLGATREWLCRRGGYQLCEPGHGAPDAHPKWIAAHQDAACGWYWTLKAADTSEIPDTEH